MNWCVSIHANEYLKLHAAVVARGGTALIMPGVPGAGKSTLCAALGLNGWRVLSDEHALIPPGTAEVVPLCRPVSLKNESIALIESFSQNAVFGPVSEETHKGTVAHMKADLAPDSHVYIDGRTNILYPLEHIIRWHDAFSSAQVLTEEITEYDIDYVIIRNTSENALLMEQTGLMQLDYADIRYLLYSGNDANTPVAGKLWARPYCWNESDTQPLDEERATAAVYFTPDTQLHQFLKLLTEYAHADDRTAYLSAQRETVYWPDASKRFVGFQAMKSANFELAHQHFRSVLKKDMKDYLAIALSELRLGKPASAESTLASALGRQWAQVEFFDLVIMHALLTEIRDQQEWTQLADSYIDELAEQIEDHQIAASGQSVTADTFCASFD